MANLPYMISAIAANKILEKIKEAATPSKFTQNYLSTTLGFDSINDKAFISFARSIGFIDPNGIPTDRYKKFRNPNTSKQVLAKGLIDAYMPLCEKNERFYDMSKDKLTELVCEETGLDHDNITAKRITNTFLEVKKLADFSNVSDNDDEVESDFEEVEEKAQPEQIDAMTKIDRTAKIGLSYNINLVLPDTDDPKVFNAIFRSLKENLL